MPGIVGLITRMPRERALPQLLWMTKALQHEPFYVLGTSHADSMGIYIGWATQKGSFSDGMPLRSERGDVVLVFSGEDFAAPGTAQWLKDQGHAVEMDGPDYLVHLYEEDPAFPARLNGRFHGIVVDHKRGKAVLFNDRYGMHRIYYHESIDAFYFASEAKAILTVCPQLRKLDEKGVGEFLACSAVLENRTLFQGINVLPPASAWSFRNGELEQKNSYFHPSEWENQERLEPDAYSSELQEAFLRILPRYFSGSQQIGMSLTGGLDTRMILACHTPAPDSLPCYTFGSMLRENQDVRLARHLAQMCKQRHEVITAGQEFLSRFPHYAERAVYLSDGLVDVSRAPDLYLNEKVRNIAPVRITGNYGGEILRGVRAFKPVPPVEGLFCKEIECQIRAAAVTYAQATDCDPVSFSAFRQAPWYQYGVLALEQTQVSMRSPFLDNEVVRTALRAPVVPYDSNEICWRLIAAGDSTLLQEPTDRGLARNTSPLSLHRMYLEFLFKAEYAYDMGMPQWLSRVDHALSLMHLEKLFLGRHKVFHFRVWYRDILANYIREMLLDSTALCRPYIERKSLEAVIRHHLKGDRNYTNEIHKLLTLEIFHRLFIDDGAEDRNRNPLLAAKGNDYHLTAVLRPDGAAGAVPPAGGATASG